MSAGSHTAVLLQEAVDELKVRADGCYIDCTFGRGGHSELILARLGGRGRLVAIDRDPRAVKAGLEIQKRDERFTMVHGSFGEIASLAAWVEVTHADGILLDLGVSSPQLDEAARGFSFRFDAPLDMRMDTTQGMTAAQWLAHADESEIREVIKNHGEERFAKQISAAIVAARASGPIDTTRQLAAIVAAAAPAREPRQDPATRTFQALRIHINQELEELSLALPQCMRLLNPGARLVVISFHSLEDRIVKRFMREASRADHLPARLPVKARDLPVAPLRLVGRARRPTDAEVAANPRSRSAVMRVAEKVQRSAA